MMLHRRILGRRRLRHLHRHADLFRRAQDDPRRARPARGQIKADLDEARRLQGGGAGAARRISSASRARPSAKPPRSSPAPSAEAERLAAEAKAKSEEFLARRTKLAETKIAQAEAQARRRCAQCRRRGRGRRRRENPDRHRQGQGRRRPDRQGHRGREGEAQLDLETAISGTLAGPIARASSAASAGLRLRALSSWLAAAAVAELRRSRHRRHISAARQPTASGSSSPPRCP